MSSLQTAVNLIYDIADRSNVGYSQGGSYPYGTRYLYATGNSDHNWWWCDCSSLISYVLYQAGFRFTTTGGYDQIVTATYSPDGYTGKINYTTTWGLYQALPSCGFTKQNITSISQYRVGDILLTDSHVVMVMSVSTNSYTTAEARGYYDYASQWAEQVINDRVRRAVYGTCYRCTSQTATARTGSTAHSTLSTTSWVQKGNYSGTKVNGNYKLTDTQMKNNLKLIYAYLRQHLGWSKSATIGVLANMRCEGIVNPDCWNYSPSKSACGMTGTDGGYGLCQWTPATKYTNSSYCPTDRTTNPKANGEGQLNFLHNYTAQWNASNSRGWTWAQYKSNTQTARVSTEMFFRWYEMYGGGDNGTLNTRLGWADTISGWITNEKWDAYVTYDTSSSTAITVETAGSDTDVSVASKTDVDWLPYYLYLKMNKKMFW